MAGQKLILGETTTEGGQTGGLPLVTVVENGTTEANDEWALFRLTDDGVSLYREGPDFRAGIMWIKLGGQSVVVEIHPRHKTEQQATCAWEKLSGKERDRTLIRSVRPKARV
jgi:hypothetical protein